MSLVIPKEILKSTTNAAFKHDRKEAERGYRDTVVVEVDKLDKDAMADLRKVAEEHGDGKLTRAIDSVLFAQQGSFDRPVPNFQAFPAVLEAFLKKDLIDGWVYVTGSDGKLYPELVTEIHASEPGRRGESSPTLRLHTTMYSCTNEEHRRHAHGVQSECHTFTPKDVARRRVADILAAKGIFKETPALKQDYEKSLKRYMDAYRGGFAKQFRVTGGVYHYQEKDYMREGEPVTNHRVIHDMAAEDFGALKAHTESEILEGMAGFDGVGAVPELPIIRVFDLATHEFYWMNSDFMEPYKYDQSLRDKLILPESHRDLLDVLTHDLSAFLEDIIEGKSAGNVILCKGIPGIGKTLTAEVYAELIEKPLYAIRSGSLGTTVENIEENLKGIFQQSKRWGCVLLLDEADVFVLERRDNIKQNAIVAEFLRVLEYFDGLLFMTTNRPSDIDDAILSRCAAVISYDIPHGKDVEAVWKVMATQNKVEIPAALLKDLTTAWPKITPRDIKMLLRLVLRVVKAKKGQLDIETFRRCAMFRGLEIPKQAG